MMGQNTSSAVMAQRVEARGSLDDFPTPPWATRALLEALSQRDMITPERQSVRDPAANRGHMVRPLSEQFAHVEAADVHDYGAGFEVADYLLAHDLDAVDWTITNPPFRLAEAFLDRALATSRAGVAFIVRLSFLEGAGRYHSIFGPRPRLSRQRSQNWQHGSAPSLYGHGLRLFGLAPAQLWRVPSGLDRALSSQV